MAGGLAFNTGLGFTITNAEMLSLHPFRFAMMVYFVFTMGLTVMEDTVCPLLHNNKPWAVVLSFIFSPKQIVSAPFRLMFGF